MFKIRRKAPTRCPVCDSNLNISRLTCPSCQTKLEGEFNPCRFCQLPADQLEFLEVFIKCRGNIKDVEKELGISYPTVKSRLETAIHSLGFKTETADHQKESREEILLALERGEISAQDAIEMLKHISD